MNTSRTSKSQRKPSQKSSKDSKNSNCPIGQQMKNKLENLNPSTSLCWSLTEEQIEFIKQYYNYTIVPELYKIQTKKFKIFENTPWIIKFLSKARKFEQKSEVICKLTKKDIESLREYDIKYSAYKYRITSTNPKTNEN